jgi:putative phosphoribosyl transferase
MRAAVRYVESYQPARIIVAVPVGSSEACADLARAADECVCLETPEPFYAVGPWYQNFDQTSDTEVQRLLDHSRPREYSNA